MAYKELLHFVAHHWKCDYLQPMWHQGPCDCGLYELMDTLPEDTLAKMRPELVQDWREDRAKRAKRRREA